MKTPTLYERIMQLEKADKDLKAIGSQTRIDLPEAERLIFAQYEHNAILADALTGAKSIEEALLDLGKINQGIRHWLPWKRNEIQNRSVEYIGNLIEKPKALLTQGTLCPDNMITMTGYVLAASYIAAGVLHFVLGPQCGLHPDPNVSIGAEPAIAAGIMGPLFGLAATTGSRPKELPIDQAMYLDSKIKELYPK